MQTQSAPARTDGLITAWRGVQLGSWCAPFANRFLFLFLCKLPFRLAFCLRRSADVISIGRSTPPSSWGCCYRCAHRLPMLTRLALVKLARKAGTSLINFRIFFHAIVGEASQPTQWHCSSSQLPFGQRCKRNPFYFSTWNFSDPVLGVVLSLLTRHESRLIGGWRWSWWCRALSSYALHSRFHPEHHINQESVAWTQ